MGEIPLRSFETLVFARFIPRAHSLKYMIIMLSAMLQNKYKLKEHGFQFYIHKVNQNRE
jgi:hypothetical protein